MRGVPSGFTLFQGRWKSTTPIRILVFIGAFRHTTGGAHRRVRQKFHHKRCVDKRKCVQGDSGHEGLAHVPDFPFPSR